MEILGAAFRVSNELGCGFLEKVYENALSVELLRRGLGVEAQKAFEVRYAGEPVGTYFSDLVVERRVIVETKVVRSLEKTHEAQCINYLRVSGLKVCLLLNFARPRLEYRRFVLHFY